MDEQNEDGTDTDVRTIEENPLGTEETEVIETAQPSKLSISSFPFAPEFMVPEKKRAIKILEEASEACEAFKRYLNDGPYSPEDRVEATKEFLEEFCDTFQALFTAAACVGVQQGQLDQAMQDCFQKNVDKGRYPNDDSEYESDESDVTDEDDGLLFPPEPPASSATYNKPPLDEFMSQFDIDSADSWSKEAMRYSYR